MSQKYSNREKSLGLSPADVPIESLPVVELSHERIQKALRLAEQRNDSYKAIDGGVVFGDDRDSLTNHQIGLLGEIAVASLYGIPIDDGIYSNGDDGTDTTLLGKGIDVKATATTKVSRPDLLVCADKGLEADLYIRAHVIDWGSARARVRIIGCASADCVKNRRPRRFPGTTRNYVVPPEEMNFLPLVRPTGN